MEPTWFASINKFKDIQLYPPYSPPSKEKKQFCIKLDADNIIDAETEAILKLRILKKRAHKNLKKNRGPRWQRKMILKQVG